MKIVILLFLFLFVFAFSTFLNAQSVFAKDYSRNSLQGLTSITDCFDKILIGGSTQEEHLGQVSSDGLLMKLDNNGEILWSNGYYFNQDALGSPAYTYFHSLLTAKDCDYVASGKIAYGLTVQGLTFVLKTDSLGNVLWHREFGQSLNNPDTYSLFANDLLVMDDGSILYLGTLSDWSMLLIKLDENGKILWQSNFSDPKHIPDNLSLNAGSDGIYLEYNIFDKTNSSILLKFNFDGKFLWSRKFFNPKYEVGIKKLLYSKSENCIYMTGDLGLDSINSNDGVLLIKADTSGNLLWARKYTSSFESFDIDNNIVQNEHRDLIIEGNIYGQPYYDLAAAVVDSDGNILYSVKLGDSLSAGNSISLFRNNEYLIQCNRLNYSLPTSIRLFKSDSVLSVKCYSSVYPITTFDVDNLIMTKKVNNLLYGSGVNTKNISFFTKTALTINESTQCFTTSSTLQNSDSKPFEIFPNPAASEIKVNNLSQVATISIADLFGRNLKNLHISKDTYSIINIQDLPAGVYLVMLKNAKGNLILSQKLLKE